MLWCLPRKQRLVLYVWSIIYPFCSHIFEADDGVACEQLWRWRGLVGSGHWALLALRGLQLWSACGLTFCEITCHFHNLLVL